MLIKQRDKKIDWDGDTTADILNKIHAADSASGSGVVETLFGEKYYLCGAHEDSILNGDRAGDIIAQRNGAICFATSDGAVWVSHLKKTNPDPLQPSKNFKLPAAMLLQ